MTNVGQYTPGKNPSTKFVVRNIAAGNKRVRIFNYPIGNGLERDLLAIPGISEADIRHSLLKGQLLYKLTHNEITIVDSDIDLLQFNDDQKAFLQAHGVTVGLEVTGGGGFPEAQHKVLRHLVHLAETGPYDGFGAALYKEINPPAAVAPTSVIWWESSAKLKKILEKTITYVPGTIFPGTITYQVYDVDGTSVLATSVDTITYSGAFEISRVRTFS